MPDDNAYPVPSHRIDRMLRLGGMTSGVLGRAVTSGLGQLARGQRPSLAGSFLTPSVATRLAQDLGRMRGAAMKLGQMLSMDTGLVLPPEMTAVLAALRADAPAMPPRQLRDVLDAEWGVGWYGRFAQFDLRPFAAASIGQVHRARLPDGRELAIKVQYPGVRASIDSDLANLGTLLRLPGLLPRGLDLGPLMEEARRQLRAEADYEAEARHLVAFGARLAASPHFALPALVPELSTARALCMTYVDSQPIEMLATTPQALRDRLAEALIELCLRELFEFGQMQTDPNLANYRFDPATGRVVLLDFGAVMTIDPALVQDFRNLLSVALGDDALATRAALFRMGYLDPAMGQAQQDLIHGLFDLAMAPLRQDRPFDFARDPLLEQLRDMGLGLAAGRELAHVPPPATLFLHRKIGGLYLLAARLGARVALRPLVERFR